MAQSSRKCTVCRNSGGFRSSRCSCFRTLLGPDSQMVNPRSRSLKSCRMWMSSNLRRPSHRFRRCLRCRTIHRLSSLGYMEGLGRKRRWFRMHWDQCKPSLGCRRVPPRSLGKSRDNSRPSHRCMSRCCSPNRRFRRPSGVRRRDWSLRSCQGFHRHWGPSSRTAHHRKRRPDRVGRWTHSSLRRQSRTP